MSGRMAGRPRPARGGPGGTRRIVRGTPQLAGPRCGPELRYRAECAIYGQFGHVQSLLTDPPLKVNVAPFSMSIEPLVQVKLAVVVTSS